MLWERKGFWLLVLAAGALSPLMGAVGEAQAGNAPFQRRQTLLEAVAEGDAPQALPLLVEALDDEALFVRRTAAHLLPRMGAPAASGLRLALENDDHEVRRIAFEGLEEIGMMSANLDKMLSEGHRLVRHAVQSLLERKLLAGGEEADALLARLAELYPKAPPANRRDILQLVSEAAPDTKRTDALLLLAAEDESSEVREAALTTMLGRVSPGSDVGEQVFAAASKASEAVREAAFQWRWEQEAVPFDEDAQELATEADLPASGWKFRRDLERTGHLEGWHEADFDDAEWKDVAIEQFWHQFLDENPDLVRQARMYRGVGWYRRTVKAPEVPEGGIVALLFMGVDECGWVWVNGRYVGQHNIGPRGWDMPFTLDVTDLIKPGEENQIAVRVMNTAAAGGIWRPVRFQVFLPANP